MAAPNQYVIRFIGKISWEGRMNGLPEEIYAFLLFEGDDHQRIINILEQQYQLFFNMRGMAAQKDQGKIIDLRQTPADRMFVPMQWIVSITADISRLIGELPHADEKGVERLTDGVEPVKH